MFKTEILRFKMHDACERVEQIEKQQVLVLSTGYEPLFRTNWKRALSAVLSGRAEIIEEHETLWVGTTSGKIAMPTVVRFITGIIAARLRSIKKTHKPSKKMLWKRDSGKCQYCDSKISLSSATIDHVVPRSRGGKETWRNLVIACSKCNCKKGSSLTSECGMIPITKPSIPKLSIYYID
jgi:5-methylcytosine-specific restriction endonuclease McrA